MSEESDAKQISTAFPLHNWTRPPERPCTPQYYVDEDKPAGPGIRPVARILHVGGHQLFVVGH